MKKPLRLASALTAAALAVAGLAGCSSSPAGADDLTEVKFLVTMAAWSPSYAPLLAADELGYYEDEGLSVEYVTFDGGTTTATQLEQGAGDLAIMSPEPVVIGKEKGSFDSKYFALMMRRSHFGVATLPGGTVQSAKDLAGAKVGVVSLASAGVQIAKGVAAEAGVDPESMQFIEIGAGPQALTAAQSGAVDALSLYDSQYQIMINSGLDVEVLHSDFVESLNAGGLAALPEKLESNPDLYVRVARAMFKGILFCSLNPEECVRLMWKAEPSTKSTTLSEEEALANDVSVLNARSEGSYVLGEGETEWGSFPDGTWETFIQYMKDSGQISGDVDPASLYTDELISEINDFDPAEVEADAKSTR